MSLPTHYKARKDALAAGERTYFTGKPCVRGHVSPRWTQRRNCIECLREDDRARYRNNLFRERERGRLRARRGLPAPTRPEPDLCEMCTRPPTARSLHLDHDHKTGQFRGWLCHYCNTNLGRFGDDIEGLTRAMDYLMRARNAAK